ncbi:MAG: serine/threonine protein kinase [Chloroflexaceae bacterium]|nr:serine/threonine protein kinase [Chloroflexaceae bacterium]
MLEPGTLVQNRYRIVRHIGQGGMGAVYEAFDQRLLNPVALKQMLVTEEVLKQAFEREAQLLARLRHPSLPKVIDHFTDSLGQFLVMEFMPGDDLATLLERQQKPFLAERVLAWTDQLLDALHYLHTQPMPVIHRDIKPQNMKLTPDDHIILLDFGLAKGAVSQQSHASSVKSTYGYTPQYAPLEQIQGAGTDPRSDLYALASSMYCLMTGSPPPSAMARANAFISHQPDPVRPAHELLPNVSPAVSEVLMRTMALNPAERPSSAMEMREQLRQARRATVRVPSDWQAAPEGSQTIAVPGDENTATMEPSSWAGVPATQRVPTGWDSSPATQRVPTGWDSSPATQRITTTSEPPPLPPAPAPTPAAAPRRRGVALWLGSGVVLLLLVVVVGLAVFLWRGGEDDVSSQVAVNSSTVTLPVGGMAADGDGTPQETVLPEATSATAPATTEAEGTSVTATAMAEAEAGAGATATAVVAAEAGARATATAMVQTVTAVAEQVAAFQATGDRPGSNAT